MFHNAAIASVVLSGGGTGDFFSINWAGAVGLCMGVSWGFGVSGKRVSYTQCFLID